jgi:hypothetical protein
MADSDPPVIPSPTARPPDDLCDMAFSCEIMEDPVVAADGYTYNRKEITLWFAKHNVRCFRHSFAFLCAFSSHTTSNTSPKTSQVLPHKMLIPNMDLRARIIAWREAHGLPAPRIANPEVADVPGPVVGADGAAILKLEADVVSELDLVFICDCTGRSD